MTVKSIKIKIVIEKKNYLTWRIRNHLKIGKEHPVSLWFMPVMKMLTSCLLFNILWNCKSCKTWHGQLQQRLQQCGKQEGTQQVLSAFTCWKTSRTEWKASRTKWRNIQENLGFGERNECSNRHYEAARKPYALAPCHTSGDSQKKLLENFYNFTSSNFWPPKFPWL